MNKYDALAEYNISTTIEENINKIQAINLEDLEYLEKDLDFYEKVNLK